MCATLAWVESKRRPSTLEREEEEGRLNVNKNRSNDLNVSGLKKFFTNTKVIYASRTHSQILQGNLKFLNFSEPRMDCYEINFCEKKFFVSFSAMNELKTTEYRYFEAGVIASRDQLCIRDDLKAYSNADKTHVCKALQTKKKLDERCEFFRNVDDGAHCNDQELQARILDIEDLDRIGRRLGCCPFYVSKKKIENADIIFMPYNYLLDPKIRKSTRISLKNAIIILDEAHNVEKMCKDSAGTQITTSKIDIAKRDLDYVSCIFIIVL